MNLNRLHWKHLALSLLLSLATLISACGGDTTEPAAEDTLYYVHTDHLGTPQVITDANQKTVWEGRALPFGETDIITSEIAFNVRFPGQYHDQESGLHYNYFRDYDPALGRYIQSDPIGLAGGVNTYGYAHQNPQKYFDSDGLVVKEAVTTAAAAAMVCAKSPACRKKVAEICEEITSRAARRKAMRDRGVPTSRSTSSQKHNTDGTRQDTVEDSSGKPSVQTEHKADTEHPKAHWHSSTPKVDPVTGKTRTNQHGNTKYETGGTTAEFD